MFQNKYKNKKVLITGASGFKGSWLTLWLQMLGAKVYGFALPPDTNPNHFSLVGADKCTNFGNINDISALQTFVKEIQPDVVFHLAAQSLVRRSYAAPVETYMVNVIGTLNVLEACRMFANPHVIIVVTSDKVYENKEQLIPYKENDELGGYDLYSSSKACAEILTSSYVRSFFNTDKYLEKHHTLIATVRAGNVIGGGDWCEDRIIPDIIRATSMNETVSIRNPKSVIPWQHVLDPLSGYLLLAEKLLEGRKELSGAWNFGPDSTSFKMVEELMEKMHENWSDIKKHDLNSSGIHPHEAGLLAVDSSKARERLGWKPVWDFENTVEKTCTWYKRFILSGEILSESQLLEYIKDAQTQGLKWTQ